jgi:8-oxo-dGTP pyrophosphatase MutT (NUDIX family)
VVGVPVRDAATVMLLRHGAAGLEVLMLRRSPRSVFVGGHHVFPGGAVDASDRAGAGDGLATTRDDVEASRRLGIDAGALAFWVAAVRECFEEAGLLLAYGPDGDVVRLDEPAVAARFDEHRRALIAGRPLRDICEDESLRLALDRVHYFGHWITPEGAPRRFDTRFFVAAAPPRQHAAHDEQETVSSRWIRPAEALAGERSGELQIILPTICALSALSGFGTVETVLGAAAAERPGMVEDGGGVRLAVPGEGGAAMSEVSSAPTEP